MVEKIIEDKERPAVGSAPSAVLMPLGDLVVWPSECVLCGVPIEEDGQYFIQICQKRISLVVFAELFCLECAGLHES